MKKVVPTLLLVLLVSWPLHATKYAGEVWSFGNQARYLALGGAGVAVASGPASLDWNVAGMLQTTGHHALGFLHGNDFGGLHTTDHLAWVTPTLLGNGTWLGVGLFLFQSPGIKVTELAYNGDSLQEGNPPVVREEVAYRAGALKVGLARRVHGVEAGLLFKFLYQDAALEAAYGLGLDAGLQWSRPHLRLGVAVHNLLPTPLFWSTGTREWIVPSVVLGGGVGVDGFRLLLDLETHFENYGGAAAFSLGAVSVDPHLGLEWQPHRLLALRAGLDRGNPTFGAGLRYRILSLDYAFLGHSDLQNSHRVSLTLWLP